MKFAKPNDGSTSAVRCGAGVIMWGGIQIDGGTNQPPSANIISARKVIAFGTRTPAKLAKRAIEIGRMSKVYIT